MSRGPGNWQRRILDALDTMGPEHVYLVPDLVRDNVPNPTRSDHVSARRAVRRLSEDGRILAGRFALDGRATALGFTRPDSEVRANVSWGANLTPVWHSSVPEGMPWQSWDPQCTGDRQKVSKLTPSFPRPRGAS